MKDVVITGIGAITPVGSSISESWDSVRRGEPNFGPVSHFDPDDFEYSYSSQISSEVDVDPTTYDCVDERNMARHSQLAMIAAAEALEDAGFGREPVWEDPQRVGVSFGNCLGDLEDVETSFVDLQERGKRPTRLSIRILSNLPAGYVSIETNAQGPNRAPSTACAAGTHAIGDAMDDIRLGRADVVIAGGSEAAIRPTLFASFDALRAISTRNDAPSEASRPFDADRDGFVVGEGGGALILESAEHAEQRGASIYASVEGAGFSADAEHPTKPPEDARGLISAVTSALADADVDPADIDHVNAHGTSTPRGDSHESHCFQQVFDEVPPVTSNKSVLGHSMAASGAVEAAFVACTIRDGVLPPTINYETPDPDCDIPVVDEPTPADVDTVLSTSAGFGGTNGAIVVRSYE